MKTNQIIGLLTVLSWIIFIGLCINAGVLVFSAIAGVYKAEPKLSYIEWDSVFSNDNSIQWHIYIGYFTLKIALASLKAWLFYLVIKALSQLNVNEPFSESMGGLIMKMAQTCLNIGILAVITHSFVRFAFEKKISVGYTGQDANFLFLAGILYVIAIIFRKGMEMQTEQELTV